LSNCGYAAQEIMSLNETDVTRIAHLAHLELSPEQTEKTREQLNGIFALVEQMQAIDTTGIAPLSHPFALVVDHLTLRLRDDVVTEENHRTTYQQCAPATQDGLYLVPKVIE
jgi:aspartyl-tRNA(Asn)/glutamyl-tRNA(Gln) amidotransferase subunit C